MLEEKRKKEREMTESSAETHTSNGKTFAPGDRIFHERFGIGHIEEIKPIGSSTMYIIDFGKQGKKAVDAAYSNLKKF